MARDSDNLVYSTDGSHRKRCPVCGADPCACPAPEPVVPERTVLRLRLDRKGRGGKAVTVVYDLPGDSGYCSRLLKLLKTHCGSGGALKDGAMEIQGDQRERVQAFLEGLGFTVRRSGG